jgi:hypothetical protein
MRSFRSLSRVQAAGTHLLLSALIGASAAALVFLVWYPGLFAQLSGVLTIFGLLVLVDVTLGPLITLVIFNTKKKELGRDLTIVAAIQLAALAYGLYTVYTGRPVYFVHNASQLDLVFASDLSSDKLATAKLPEFRSLPVWGPRLIAAPMPADPAEAAKIVTAAVSGGDDIQYLPEYYVPFETVTSRALAQLKPLASLRAPEPKDQPALDKLRSAYAATASKVGYLPVKASAQPAVAIFERDTGKLLELAPFLAGQ